MESPPLLCRSLESKRPSHHDFIETLVGRWSISNHFHSQPFWGEMVAKAGAGPRPIPHTEMTADLLAEGIRYCLSNEAVAAAASLAANMESERGVRAAVQSFHRQLPLERIRCDLIPEHPAVWVYSKSKPPIKLSKIAAEIILVNTPAESKHMKM
jgi:Glycosyl transferases, related to UDP-glucuronosyltransferase